MWRVEIRFFSRNDLPRLSNFRRFETQKIKIVATVTVRADHLSRAAGHSARLLCVLAVSLGWMGGDTVFSCVDYM